MVVYEVVLKGIGKDVHAGVHVPEKAPFVCIFSGRSGYERFRPEQARALAAALLEAAKVAEENEKSK